MFCQNCGKNLEQGELFCSACGTKVEAQPAQPVEPTYTAPAEPVYTAPIEPTYTAPTPVEPAYAAPVVPAPAKSKKKLFIILGIIAAAVVIIAVAAYFVISEMNDTPENVAEDFVVANYTYDVELMLDCVPEYVINGVADNLGIAPTKDAVISAMQAEYLGKTPKTVEVVSAVRTYKFTYQDFLEDAEDIVFEMGGTYEDITKVTDACQVEVKVFIDGELRTKKIDCVEYDGDWCAIDD